ncbi:hypothetical protein OE88DRAFT_1603312, partial [Heliocybe sulcata]
RKNDEAHAEMVLHVEEEQLAHMTSTVTADVWAELERVHWARGFATRISLHRQFMSMRMKKEQAMPSWI